MNNLISVIIPTYKSRGGLSKAINSVLRQEGVNVEVIIIDDNDPMSDERKKTEEEMTNFSSFDNVIYICHERNKNGAAARNTGIKASHGEFIAFLDDDDLFLPNKLKNQLDFLNHHSEFNAVYGQILSSGRILDDNLPEGDLSKQVLLLKARLQTSTLLFRRNSLVDISGFDEQFFRHQDYEMLLRYFKAGNKIGVVQAPVIEFGRNAGENIPFGERLEKIKEIFLSNFEDYIEYYEKEDPGFRNRVYATHYSTVFMSHLKHCYFLKATKIMLKYSFKAPLNFWEPLFKSLKIHIQGNIW